MEYGQFRDLENWADGWRFPDIWLRLINGEEPDSDAVLRNLLRGYTKPILPSALWNRLLTDGEFKAARSLLDNREFLGSWREEDREELDRQLERHRSERLRKIEAHTNQLAARTRRIGYPLKLVRAEILLMGEEHANLAEEQIECAERELLAQEQGHRYYSPPPGLDNDFGVDCAVTRKNWSYDKDPIDKLCRWILGKEDLQRAPPDFLEQYRFDPRDLYATGVASLLLELIECPALERSERLQAFLHALTNFLRNESTSAPSVRDAGNHFVTELTGCSSPWLPAIHVRHGPNIPLIVPHTAGTKITTDEIGDGLVCLLDIWKLKPKIPEHCINIEIGWLFRLMGLDEERRLHAFHCFLGRAIPLSQALPETDGNSDCGAWLENLPGLSMERSGETELDILGFDDAYILVNRLFQVHGIRRQHESDFARVARLAVGPTWIFCRYLRQLLQELAEKDRIVRPVLDHDLIEAVWNDPEFQPPVDELLAPLSDASLAHLLLLLILFESMTLDARMQDSSMDTEMVLKGLDDALSGKKEPSRDTINIALQTLAERGFIHISPKNDLLFLVENSVINLLISQLGDKIDEYINDTVDRLDSA
uniref:Uncharacterized protein n=1 Tax=Candidatus Kentrum sp. DK TaxID=2126562 RepID=A0A450S867_9GAMM|nr:MAG: hypothetical protein BECKDK2373B_GA0170837_100168 [Candidatus Kentron sp. DK]VFJ48102.1 MAG: hypothetical protein BECKDK2373C_GA0170839_10208 [Candidatus Kentron sp. DK]